MARFEQVRKMVVNGTQGLKRALYGQQSLCFGRMQVSYKHGRVSSSQSVGVGSNPAHWARRHFEPSPHQCAKPHLHFAAAAKISAQEFFRLFSCSSN